jgi:hypothetical protein
MSTPPAPCLLELWERALPHHPLDRALDLLEVDEPAGDRATLAALPIGVRDARLCALYRRWFAATAPAEARCPACAAAIELDVPLESAGDAAAAVAREIAVEGFTLRLRAPTSRDLAAAAETGAAAVETLLGRCVEARGADGAASAVAALPEAVRARLPEELRALDPDAEMVVATVCPDCGTTVELVVDPLALLWAEVDATARRLLAEVHRLADRYGWSERDVLALSPARRRHYLALAAT